jgi:glutamyl/glutaminyl-tRNA synthetase
MIHDLKWFGFEWQEGPDIGGPFGPYSQSERMEHYQKTFERLKTNGTIYPCTCSRQDVLRALQAPHPGEEEPVYPGTCRLKKMEEIPAGARVSWRFRVPDDERISFDDGGLGFQQYTGGQDFGDFVIWRHDNMPSYQLACTVDDNAMRITEVVRGADLLLSTARQLLIYRALGMNAPQFFHCELMRDDHGVRLAKRNDALSLRRLRGQGEKPEALRASWGLSSPVTTRCSSDLVEDSIRSSS